MKTFTSYLIEAQEKELETFGVKNPSDKLTKIFEAVAKARKSGCKIVYDPRKEANKNWLIVVPKSFKSLRAFRDLADWRSMKSAMQYNGFVSEDVSLYINVDFANETMFQCDNGFVPARCYDEQDHDVDARKVFPESILAWYEENGFVFDDEEGE